MTAPPKKSGPPRQERPKNNYSLVLVLSLRLVRKFDFSRDPTPYGQGHLEPHSSVRGQQLLPRSTSESPVVLN